MCSKWALPSIVHVQNVLVIVLGNISGQQILHADRYKHSPQRGTLS